MFPEIDKESLCFQNWETGRKCDKCIFVLVHGWHCAAMGPEMSKKCDVSGAVSEENDVALKHLKFLS